MQVASFRWNLISIRYICIYIYIVLYICQHTYVLVGEWISNLLKFYYHIQCKPFDCVYFARSTFRLDILSIEDKIKCPTHSGIRSITITFTLTNPNNSNSTEICQETQIVLSKVYTNDVRAQKTENLRIEKSLWNASNFAVFLQRLEFIFWDLIHCSYLNLCSFTHVVNDNILIVLCPWKCWC